MLRRLIACLFAAVSLSSVAMAYDWTAVDDRLYYATNPYDYPAPPYGTTCIGGEACGLTTMVTDGDTTVVYNEPFGTFKGAEVIDLASATKWASAAAIMTLVDQGKLSLKTKVSDLITKWRRTAVGSITLAQLLSHTSGLQGDNPCVNDATTTLSACADTILSQPLVYKPGTAFLYGGASFQVAGRMAEIASGVSWNQLFLQRISGPLGMTTFVYAYSSPNNPRIGGGGVSSAADYDRLLRMHQARGVFAGKRILSTTSIQQMETDRIVGLPILYSPRTTTLGYGLGIWIDAKDSYGNAVRVTSPGAFGTFPWVDNQIKYRGILLMDSSYDYGEGIYDDIRPVFDTQLK